jgi:hypothetical protein
MQPCRLRRTARPPLPPGATDQIGAASATPVSAITTPAETQTHDPTAQDPECSAVRIEVARNDKRRCSGYRTGNHQRKGKRRDPFHRSTMTWSSDRMIRANYRLCRRQGAGRLNCGRLQSHLGSGHGDPAVG